LHLAAAYRGKGKRRGEGGKKGRGKAEEHRKAGAEKGVGLGVVNIITDLERCSK